MPSSRELSQPRDQTQVSPIAGGFFTVWATREALDRLYTLRLIFVDLESVLFIFESFIRLLVTV